MPAADDIISLTHVKLHQQQDFSPCIPSYSFSQSVSEPGSKCWFWLANSEIWISTGPCPFILSNLCPKAGVDKLWPSRCCWTLNLIAPARFNQHGREWKQYNLSTLLLYCHWKPYSIPQLSEVWQISWWQRFLLVVAPMSGFPVLGMVTKIFSNSCLESGAAQFYRNSTDCISWDMAIGLFLRFNILFIHTWKHRHHGCYPKHLVVLLQYFFSDEALFCTVGPVSSMVHGVTFGWHSLNEKAAVLQSRMVQFIVKDKHDFPSFNIMITVVCLIHKSQNVQGKWVESGVYSW